MIVFGHNSFKIKSFTQRELKLPKEEGLDGIDIQVRQRYAHLFWIPVFPIGKVYCFKRRGDSSYYELPKGIKEAIGRNQKIKTPWYSYSLLILLLLVGSWFFIQEELNSIDYKNSLYLKQAENIMKVKYPTTGDYYSFDAYNNKRGYKNISRS